tara:strand:+ start:349 stop:525 length:177 start_codon:yes stop_codon:yes gene_type:complete
MKDDFKELISIIEQEGFHSTFKQYSDFNKIKEPEFHKLRNYYLQYADLLERYIDERCK